jgi:hypothetical protein
MSKEATMEQNLTESCVSSGMPQRREFHLKAGSIWKKKSDDIVLTIAKFYRPENTHQGKAASYGADQNMLYWSDEQADVSLSNVEGKCAVKFYQDTPQFEKFLQQDDTFYFKQA